MLNFSKDDFETTDVVTNFNSEKQNSIPEALIDSQSFSFTLMGAPKVIEVQKEVEKEKEKEN